MKDRLIWVDSLKGLSIFLMVMGHVIAWQFNDWSQIMSSYPRTIIPVWNIIYSFHMPLFAFCSGLFLAKPFGWYNMASLMNVFQKRVTSLLVPFFIVGYLASLIGRPLFDYWYLMTLFEFSIITTIVSYLTKQLSSTEKFTKYIEFAILLTFAFLCDIVGEYLRTYDTLDIFKFSHLPLYKYLLLGGVTTRFNLIRFVTNVKIGSLFYTCSLFVFMTLNYCHLNGHVRYPTPEICAFSGIILAVCYFVLHESNTKWFCKVIQWLGRHSMEIYILHFFFMTKFPELGDYTIKVFENKGLSPVFVFQFLTSFFESCIIIVLCCIAINIISKSKLLSKLLFGR